MIFLLSEVSREFDAHDIMIWKLSWVDTSRQLRELHFHVVFKLYFGTLT